MIITKISGGLGNQMFQYAYGYVLAKTYNVPLGLDTTFYKTRTKRVFNLDKFNIDGAVIDPTNLPNVKYMNEQHGDVVHASDLENNAHLHLTGFWITDQYYTPELIDDIKNQFTLKYSVNPTTATLASQIRATTSVSLHVRRGDFVTKPTKNICLAPYYTEAVNYFNTQLNNPTLFIFSDDPAWVKSHLHFTNNTVYVIHNGDERNYEDLYLMSLCNHHVIANSTFSWWGAWLHKYSDNIVVFPNQWNVDNPLTPINQVIPQRWQDIGKKI